MIIKKVGNNTRPERRIRGQFGCLPNLLVYPKSVGMDELGEIAGYDRKINKR